jgi:hypothetical protein
MQKQMVHGNAQDGVGKYFVSASKKSRWGISWNYPWLNDSVHVLF